MCHIEPRPKGPRGQPVEDFVVEDHADHILAFFRTQREAIDWSHAPLVARVRHLNDKKRPDHWRSASCGSGVAPLVSARPPKYLRHQWDAEA